MITIFELKLKCIIKYRTMRGFARLLSVLPIFDCSPTIVMKRITDHCPVSNRARYFYFFFISLSEHRRARLRWRKTALTASQLH